MRAIVVGTFAIVLFLTTPLLAHHSFANEYDGGKPLTLAGKMVSFDWANPHSWVIIEVTNPDGTKTRWQGQTRPVNVLARNGWTEQITQEMARSGETIVLRGFAAKDGSSHLYATSATRAGGQTLELGPPPRF